MRKPISSKSQHQEESERHFIQFDVTFTSKPCFEVKTWYFAFIIIHYISSCVISHNSEAVISTKWFPYFKRSFSQHVHHQIILQADPVERAQKELSNGILHSQNWLLDWNLCLSEVNVPYILKRNPFSHPSLKLYIMKV